MRVGGVLDTWLTPLKAIRNANKDELMAIRDEKARAIRIAELNVEAGVKVLLANITIHEYVFLTLLFVFISLLSSDNTILTSVYLILKRSKNMESGFSNT